MRILGCTVMMLTGLMLAACGGGETEGPEPQARYVGSKLVVRGVSYERQPSLRLCPFVVVTLPNDTVCDADLPLYKARELLLAFKPGQEDAGLQLLSQMGLNTFERRGRLFLAVPALFEAQWLQALEREDVFEFVETNGVMFYVTP